MALTYPIRPVARPLNRLMPRLFDVMVATLIFTVLT
jgi:hypothetical protein